MRTLSDLKIAVIGGSYGGLCSALAMRCVGADVHIYERSEQYNRIGGGIVVQPDFAEYLESFGYARPETVAVPTTQRKFLSRDGSIKHSTRDSTFYTGWDTVLRALRDAFDPDRIHNGMPLKSFRSSRESVELEFANGERRAADLMIAADGIGSVVRRQLEPDIEPAYAGYVGYRGLVPESKLSELQRELFTDSFVLYDYPHSHLLCYLIPGEDGQRTPGERRFNWVWYVSHTQQELAALLTDRDGYQHRAALGPGEMASAWEAKLKQRASEALPTLLADAVAETAAPFVQVIFDLAVPRMVYDRVILLGDAAFLVRPHTAAGASKAAADAIDLAHALQDDSGPLAERLATWERARIQAAQRIIAHGLMIAARGGLGG